jgi:hypothetical protein
VTPFAIAALLLPLAALGAQTVPSPHEASTALHAAWLRELMDLDVQGAVRDYEAIAKDTRPTHLERWVAAARLAELERTGIAVGYRAPVADAPPALRAAFASLEIGLAHAELLRRATGDPAQVLVAIGAEAGRLPNLRTITPVAQVWLRDQVGPSVDDRWRQRLQVRNLTNRARPDANRPSERWYAADILSVELQGRQEQAANLRTLYFTDWRPPTLPGDAAEGLATVRKNLESWLQEPDTSPQQQALLRQLREAIDQRAAADPASALTFVSRMPIYAERLFGTAPAGR